MATDAYSFVVRVWREPADDERGVAVWRGSIDNVASGERSYFTDLGRIPPFIVKHVGWTLEAQPADHEYRVEPEQV